MAGCCPAGSVTPLFGTVKVRGARRNLQRMVSGVERLAVDFEVFMSSSESQNFCTRGSPHDWRTRRMLALFLSHRNVVRGKETGKNSVDNMTVKLCISN